jgi:hypothetical protein
MILLRLENDMNLLLFFMGIGALILWFSILRWAVRSNKIVRNQAAIIYLMKHQLVKQGTTGEELKKIEEDIEKILES